MQQWHEHHCCNKTVSGWMYVMYHKMKHVYIIIIGLRTYSYIDPNCIGPLEEYTTNILINGHSMKPTSNEFLVCL